MGASSARSSDHGGLHLIRQVRGVLEKLMSAGKLERDRVFCCEGVVHVGKRTPVLALAIFARLLKHVSARKFEFQITR